MTGKVYLVGAGPGDPDLLTFKAARLLQSADVILHDDLVAPAILELAGSAAKLHNVGKRCGKKKISQAEINFLMIEIAALGMKVVRLHGGDPLIFGRLGEEITALRRASVDFEIVPGVTSAFGVAATAQFPLTDRQSSSAAILLTGHRAGGRKETDWRKYVSTGATLIIYMPGRDYLELRTRLLAAGAHPETPCAIASHATTADQQTFITSVNDLSQAPQLPAPTLIVVGDVVNFAANVQLHSPGIAKLFVQDARTGAEKESIA
jgi:uroporphyrin-III C-methyltransferase